MMRDACGPCGSNQVPKLRDPADRPYRLGRKGWSGPLTIRRRPGRKTVVTPVRAGGAAALATRADPTLVKALASAFRYQRLLAEGRYASVSEMAAAERLERGYLGSLLRLTLLAPDIVEAILHGRRPDSVMLPRLLHAFRSTGHSNCARSSTPAHRRSRHEVRHLTLPRLLIPLG